VLRLQPGASYVDESGHLRMSVGRIRYHVGLFEIDPTSGRLWRQGEPVRLQDQPFRILLALLERPGELVTRDDLRQRLWPSETFVEFDKSLGVALAKLRAALGDDAANPRFIETVPRRGYRLIAPASLEGDGLSPQATPSAQRPRRIPVWLVAGVAAAAVAGVWSWRRRPAPAAAPAARLVVAEFENTTGDAAFHGSLRRATTVALQQSPFLRVLPDATIGETLQELGHPPAETLSAALARDVCRRTGASAVVGGRISNADEGYVVTIGANRCSDGLALARETGSFRRREDVLPGLGRAIERLRRTLGESRTSLDSYSVPLEIATSDSLDALRAYQLGVDLRARSDNLRAIPAFKTAVALDPRFALAYAQLGSAYSNLGDATDGAPYLQKAFELRDRATEPERLYITGRYFDVVTGELEKASATYLSWTKVYPDEWTAFNALANDANQIGRYDVAVGAASRAVELNPRHLFGQINLMTALAALHRFDQARAVADRILDRDPDNSTAHLARYAMASLEGDEAASAREVAWGRQHPDDSGMPYVEAEAAAQHGRIAESLKLFEAVARMDEAGGNDDSAADALAVSAEFAALVGEDAAAQRVSDAALALARNETVSGLAALVNALTGRPRLARQQLDELERAHPLSTFTLGIYAAMAHLLLSGPGVSAAQVTDLMSAARPYELGQEAGLLPAFVRGRAYLTAHAPLQAVPEFQTVIDHVGVDPVTPLYPLAYLELGRAEAALGQAEKSRAAYRRFLAFWKQADRDLPLWRAAQHELGGSNKMVAE
jgi:DNA-binding winged helix-turn-helix (wHTH) protein/tetratricopeptide (TPR) repeat protein